MVLLSDEQIYGELMNPGLKSKTPFDDCRAIAKAQVKKIYQWGEEPCPHGGKGQRKKRHCYGCWQQLKKEIEL